MEETNEQPLRGKLGAGSVIRAGILRARKSFLNLSNEDIRKMTGGMAPSTISSILNGHEHHDVAKVTRLSLALGLLGDFTFRPLQVDGFEVALSGKPTTRYSVFFGGDKWNVLDDELNVVAACVNEEIARLLAAVLNLQAQ